MKLLKSWNSYKDRERLHGRLTLSKYQSSIYRYCQFTSLAFLLIIAACEEKIPTIQNPGDFYDINTLTISADSMTVAQAVVNPGIGQSDILYIGNDENVYAYTLLKFGEIDYYLPDSVEKFISLKLNLRSDRQYRLDSSNNDTIKIEILHLENDGADPWTEDSSHFGNFKIENYKNLGKLRVLAEFPYTDSDTVVINLDTALVSQWYKVTNEDYTLVLMQSDTNKTAVQTFHSTESPYYPWLEVAYYVVGDTSLKSSYILPTEDLSIINIKNPAESSNLLSINSGRASFGVLFFNFEDTLTDENIIIAKADLRLKIDRENTVQYGEDFSLYISYADSNILKYDLTDSTYYVDPLYFPPSVSEGIIRNINTTADSVIIDIKSLLQLTTSYEDVNNYGIVLYTVPTFSNISTLSLYNASDQNPAGFRPSLRILTMKEQ
ncbi:hypothetical protein KJ762_09985 [bacterium]|nr:hypothetical protein [bacterium]MBU1064056.1 hypothetical protein [bacterium]MBU1634824.1 hypothetical protein [bacterium]MBU1874687.1 hypothetical protein [bacterium]